MLHNHIICGNVRYKLIIKILKKIRQLTIIMIIMIM